MEGMHMTTFKLGKHVPKSDKRTLLFGKYLTAALQPPPPAVDYSKPVTVWPMMGNDAYGDCTCAAAGPNMLDVLKYWRKTGIGGDKITAFAQLEPKNGIQARDAVNLFGNCYIGVALPNFAVAPGTDFLQTPWVVPPQGPVGNAAPNPQNGHCIPAVGYDARNLYVVTWGALKSMSWQFYDAYMDEAFAVLSGDWINTKVGTSPSGFNMAALQKDLAAVIAAPAAAAA